MLNTSRSSASGLGRIHPASSSLLSSPFSSSNLHSSLSSSPSRRDVSRRSWFPSVFPVHPTVEDASVDLEEELRQLQVGSEAEEAEEVTEKSDLDAAAEDRAMPLAFNGLRHEEDIVGELTRNIADFSL